MVSGSLKPGKRADLITLRADAPNMTPSGDPYFTVVFSAQPANIDLVVADGRIVAQGGALRTLNQRDIVRSARAAADALAARAPKV
mgnify:CR=1 FL=1